MSGMSGLGSSSFVPAAPVLVAFIAGFFSFVSPCVFPLIPSYLSYISGFSVTELTAGAGAGTALFATGLHSAGYLAVTALVAVVVFERIGVGILRRAWFNLDLVWSAALIATGTLALIL